ncbi:tail fiber domain-containing protein [Enterobacter sp. MW07]|nr:tail fiber domain-containing protein [Enterobacter sp. MW07]
MLYTIGTISVNGNTATGTGTNWTAPASQIRLGQTLVVLSNPVQLFQITAINSATSLTVTPAASPALTGQKYGILVTDAMSVDGLAQSISQLINQYDENIGAWETFATTSANQNITVTINGKAVTIPAIGGLARNSSNLSDLTDKAAAWLNIRPSGSTPLAADPVSALDATTKRWVETLITSAPTLSASGAVYSSTGFSISGTSTPFVAMFPAGANSNAIGGRTRLETTIDSFSSAISVINFSRRRSDGISTGAIDVQIPQSSGTLALQGTSDINYKKDVKPYDGQQSVENIKAMDLVTFVFRDDEKERPRRGVIAQQIEEIDPSYVKHTFEPEGEEVYDKEGNFCGYEGKRERVVLDTNVMLLDTICALKVALTRIDALEKEISMLKN